MSVGRERNKPYSKTSSNSRATRLLLTTMEAESFPFLPPELEHEIFDWTANLYPETIPSLLLVAKRVCESIEKIKYRTVTEARNHSACSYNALKCAILSRSRPASFFQNHVRHLYVSVNNANTDELREILTACSRVESLAVVYYQWSSLFPILATLKPRRLSIPLAPLFVEADLCRPLFTSVTHLNVSEYIGDHDNLARWPSFLALLPALTHLSMYFGFKIAGDILAGCKKLEVLLDIEDPLVVSLIPESLERLNSLDDHRLVCMVMEDCPTDYMDDWIPGVKGGPDRWSRAEAFIAKKRRGEINPGSRCIIEEADGIQVTWRTDLYPNRSRCSIQ
ncbi:hypothetical protein B0H19DRAFT_715836 [Mycena capillaripes]|nr:hypothetical protein B0H19DRAFT_715836 [Mycena capillaripes]